MWKKLSDKEWLAAPKEYKEAIREYWLGTPIPKYIKDKYSKYFM